MFRKSIGLRIFALVACVLLAVSTLLSVFFIRSYTNRVIEDFRTRGTLVADGFARNVANDIVIEDIDAMSTRLANLLKLQDVVLGEIIDPAGTVLTHKYGFASDGPLETDAARLATPSAEPVSTRLPDKTPILLFHVGSRSDDGKAAGSVRVGLSLESLSREKAAILRSFVLLVTLLLSVGLAGSYAFSRTLSRPVLELAEVSKKIAAGDYGTEIPVRRQDEIGVLAEGFREMRAGIVRRDTELAAINANLEKLVAERTSELRQSVHKTVEILNNVEEGVMILDAGMKCGTDLSPALGRIYGVDPAGIAEMNVLDFLFPKSDLSADAMNACKECLGVLFGMDLLCWELNHGHLPSEARIVNYASEEKAVAISWRPIIENDVIERIVLGVRDVTLERKLQKEVKEARSSHEALLRKVDELIRCRGEDVGTYMTETGSRVARLRSLAESFACPDSLERIFIELHTIKGASRALGLKSITELTHDAEELVKGLRASGRDENGGIGVLPEALLYDAITRLAAEVDDYKGVYERYLGGAATGNPGSSGRSLVSIVSSLTPSVRQRLEAGGFELNGVEIVDELGELDDERASAFSEILLHALGNSVDHGFVIPRRRGREAPTPLARFRVQGRRLPGTGGVRLTVEDNGSGIDLQAVRQLAAQRKFAYSGEEELLGLLFLPETSTADQVTETSGRGVGLLAIKTAVSSLGGTISLRRGAPHGTTLEISIPPSEAAEQPAETARAA